MKITLTMDEEIAAVLMLATEWQYAEIHEHGLVIKRLAGDFPHGCMAGNLLFVLKHITVI